MESSNTEVVAMSTSFHDHLSNVLRISDIVTLYVKSNFILVQKYRQTEDGLGKRVQKLNWHSVAKKSSRINQKITQFTGLNSQV